MVVRLRFPRGPLVKRAGKNDKAVLALSALLTPAALMACVLASWRLGADLGIAGAFAIREGLFSHWQVWFAVAGVLEIAAVVLSRLGQAMSPVHSDRSKEALELTEGRLPSPARSRGGTTR